MITTILVPIGAIIFLKLSRFYQFVVLSLSALLPFSFGDFRSIPNFLFVEWIPFVTLLIIINDLNPINKIKKKINIINFNGIGIFLFALMILIVWSLIGFVDNEVLMESSKNIVKEGTTRIYFNTFMNVILFFTVILFIAIYNDQINYEKFFKILLYTALFLGALRIFTHFVYPFAVPLLEREFTSGGYYWTSQKVYGGRAYRFGFFEKVVTFGIPALFSYYVYTKKINFFALILLLLYLFMGGGRTIAVGTVIPIIVFSFFFFPKNFLYMIIGGTLFLVVAFLVIPESLLQGQSGRMITFKKGFMGMDLGRTLAYTKFWETFLANPFFGKGIGSYTGYIYSNASDLKEFAEQLLFAGGHGSYISLLAIYGFGGLTYLVLMLFGGIVQSYKKINQYLHENKDKTAIAVFTFMILMIKAIYYLTSENGLSLPEMFYSVGLIASLTVLQNKENILSANRN